MLYVTKSATEKCYNLLKLRMKNVFEMDYDNSSGEVDFVLQRGNKVILVEVKAEENLQAKSLRALCKKYELSDAVRSSK